MTNLILKPSLFITPGGGGGGYTSTRKLNNQQLVKRRNFVGSDRQEKCWLKHNKFAKPSKLGSIVHLYDTTISSSFGQKYLCFKFLNSVQTRTFQDQDVFCSRFNSKKKKSNVLFPRRLKTL